MLSSAPQSVLSAQQRAFHPCPAMGVRHVNIINLGFYCTYTYYSQYQGVVVIQKPFLLSIIC